jgi:hypothetical protein
MAALARQLGSVLVLVGCCCAVFLAAGCALVARAQDPFAPPKPGGAAAPGEDAAPPKPQDPFGGGPAAKPAAEKGKGPQLLEEALPLVLQQLRDSNPQTPKAILQAAIAVLQYGRPDETKRYLAQFLAAKFPEDQLAPVPHQVGSDLLLHIARNEKVQPEGKEVARIVQEAAYKRATDPAEIEKTIALLSNPSLSIRQTALEKLAESGTHVVTPMLRVLADSSRESEHRYVRVALAHLSVATEAPLIGALAIPDEHTRAQVVAVLGRIRSKPAVMHFVRPAVDPAATSELREVAAASLTKIVGSAPDRYAAEKYLQEQIQSLLAGNLPYAADPDGLVEMWFWDDAQRAVASRKLSKGDAALLLATRLSDDLAALNPQSESARRMKVLTSLELAKVLAGLDQPLPTGAGTAADEAAKAGPEFLSSVLAEALKLGRIPAVLATVELLGQSGNPEVLTSAGPQESPLAKALAHTDRRVRLMAALAVARLKPQVAFPGASRVYDPLAAAIRTTGASRVLIGHPRGEEAQTLVGFMNDLGYEGEAAYTGRRLAEAATSGVDYEFILVSDAIDSPPVKELVQWLRKDYRTAGIPIGVMARTEDLYPLRYAFENDPLTSVFPRLYTSEAAGGEVAKVIASAGRNHIGREERVAQAQAAIVAIADLAASREAFTNWNIVRYESALVEALNNPAFSAQAAAVLGKLGTPTSQKALVDLASQYTRPLSDRQAAAAAFAAAVKARGLNLTQQQIMTQFDRYNASERQDAQTQAVLGSVLDAIEAPTANTNQAVTTNE